MGWRRRLRSSRASERGQASEAPQHQAAHEQAAARADGGFGVDSSPATWAVGDRVADLYEVREVHGQGGMGLVYRVRHLGWEVDLAVKSPTAPVMRR
jgi:hypothetical protein